MKTARQHSLGQLLTFLEKLKKAKIAFSLRHSRDDAVMIRINVPGERWEVEFLEDGDIDVERFTSDGKIYDQKLLRELFARFSDEETPSAAAANNAVARK